MSQQYKSPDVLSKILLRLEFEILKRGNKMSSKDACSFHISLISCYYEFLESFLGSFNGYAFDNFSHPHHKFACANFLRKKAFQLEQKLLQFFTPEYTISSIPFDFKVNDEHAATSSLPALFRKQTFYIEMIDSLEPVDPTNDLNPEQTKVQSKHLDQFHKEFISNQSEITSIIEDASFAEQVEISQKVEQKVRKIQTQLEQSISPIDTSIPIPASNSLLQKQKYYIKMIDALESSDNLNQKDAKVQSEQLSQFEEKFIVNQSELIALIGDASYDQVEISQKVQQKVCKIQAKLKEISAMKTIPPAPPLPPEHFNQTERRRVIVPKDALFDGQVEISQKVQQQAKVKEISSMKTIPPAPPLPPEHFNQTERRRVIVVKDASFDGRVEISQKVQQNVRKIPAELKEISAMKTIPPAPPFPSTSSLVNEHFNQTERPRVIVDFLDSLTKKQISLIEQIELIESKNDLSTTEAETLHSHLSQLHDAFVGNQSKIETYVSGPALDEQLLINGDVLQKVMTLQTKLKDIFSLVKPPSENVSTDCAQLKLSDSVHYVNWLFDRLTDLEKDMKEIVYRKCMPSSVLPSMEEYWTWFVSYQNELKQLVAESPYDLKKIRDISSNAYGYVTCCRWRVEREQQLEREKNRV